MPNPFVYAIAPNGDLSWFRHVGASDGSFRWEGPTKVGTGWAGMQKVFSGGNGIVYAIEAFVDASVSASDVFVPSTGGVAHGRHVPAHGGRLLWYRHLGRADGSFRWEGPLAVGTGWSGFEHVFSGGDGVIYAIEPLVEARVSVEGHVTPAHGGNLLWYRHVGQADGSFRWEGPKKVGTGWSGLAHVFSGGDGIVYAIEPAVEASAKAEQVLVPATGGIGHSGFVPAHGGRLLWYRHLGASDGSFRWEGPHAVGTGWSGLEQVFSGGDGVIYGVEPLTAALAQSVGRPIQVQGGNLRWYRHLGASDGSFRWDGPKKVGIGWGGLKLAFSGGREAPANHAGHRFCGVPDPSQGGLHPSTFGAPGGRWRRGNLSYRVDATNSGLTQAAVNAVLAAAFAVWQGAAPYFSFVQVVGAADITIRFGGASLDDGLGSASGVLGVGHYPEDGRLNLDSAEIWTPALLGSVVLHEIGHVLGLRHSTSRASLMYPYDLSNGLDTESIEAINGLYGWLPQQSLGDRGSIDAPSLATAGHDSFAAGDHQLYMAWRGVHGDTSVYWSTLAGERWSQQARIEGIGSAHGPVLASGYTSNSGGVMTTGLFMAWDGAPGDDAVYFARNDDPAFQGWSGQGQIPGAGTSDRPALMMFKGRMHAAWKGVAGDSSLYWSRLDDAGWRTPQHIAGRGSARGPALAVLGNRLYMFWKGIDGDNDAYFAWLDDQPNAIWQAQNRIAYTEAQAEGNTPIAIGTSGRLSATVRDGAIVLAWKGVPGDTGLYFSRLRDDEWSGQTCVAGAGSSSGPALAELDGRLHLAWTGLPGDTGLYYSRLG